jgi:hypothetical protein
LVKTLLQPKALASDGYQHINRDGDPDLSLHSVLAGAVERFDAKVLFDPFEKLVSQNQTKPGGAKKRRLHFKSKKVEMSLKPLGYRQLRRYENSTTGQ